MVVSILIDKEYAKFPAFSGFFLCDLSAVRKKLVVTDVEVELAVVAEEVIINSYIYCKLCSGSAELLNLLTPINKSDSVQKYVRNSTKQ